VFYVHPLRNTIKVTANVLVCSVLIDTNEVAKISDFGTCRQLNEMSTRMSFAGTVSWMAPEIIRNEPCSEKVDIW